MNKLSMLAIAALAVVAGANAQTKKTEKAATTIACAVMPPNNKVDIAKATSKHMYADYKGRRYFFCGGCPDAFKKDPAKYAKAASIATPKTKKA